MQALLHNPAFQAGVVPFIVALIVAELLQRVRLSGLVLVLGFAVMVYLSHAFAFGVLTAPRKIVVLGVASPLLAILPAVFHGKWVRPVLVAAGALAAVWMSLRILQNQMTAHMLLWGAGGALYTGWLVFWTSKLHKQPVRAGAAGLALGVGAGVAAIFGASLTLGMFGAAIGSAAGAYLLIHMLSNTYLPCGHVYTLPLAIIIGLVGTLSAMATEVPWYALLPLAAIPPVALLIPIAGRPALWLQSLLLSAATLLLAGAAVFITWRVAGAPPI